MGTVTASNKKDPELAPFVIVLFRILHLRVVSCPRVHCIATSNRRLESVIRAPDLVDVRIRESGTAVEGNDGKSRRNVSNVGANDHKKTLTLYHLHGYHTTTAGANDELKFLATTLQSQSSLPPAMKWLSLLKR